MVAWLPPWGSWREARKGGETERGAKAGTLCEKIETKRINIHKIAHKNEKYTLAPSARAEEKKAKTKNSKSGLDTGGGYAIMPLKGKDLPFSLFWVSIFYTP